MQNIISNFDAISEEIMSQYAGEWIAVVDNKVIAHSKSFKEVYNLAKENYPHKKPLMGKLPENFPTVLSVY
ncbi:MAG: hypothetical protein KKA64_00150 [Nanoarchaeota archaeon]|nr:hypothetical protein [Nanoarchaeota archaeon]